jgi:UDP-N-acetylmuramate dehydrogenase
MMMHEPPQLIGLRGRLAQRAPLAKYTSWRAGGTAETLYLPADRDDLAAFLRQLTVFEPITVLGLGSNVLVRDGGIRGTVIVMHNPGATLAVSDGLIYADAGAASPKLARFAATHGCTEAEFLAGVPGTVGGALAMNAGCYGGETWRYVVRVESRDARRPLRRAHAGGLRHRLSQRTPHRRLAARRNLHRCMVPVPGR